MKKFLACAALLFAASCGICRRAEPDRLGSAAGLKGHPLWDSWFESARRLRRGGYFVEGTRGPARLPRPRRPIARASSSRARTQPRPTSTARCCWTG